MKPIIRLGQISIIAALLLNTESAFSNDKESDSSRNAKSASKHDTESDSSLKCRRSDLNISAGYRNDTYKRDNTTKTDSNVKIQKDKVDVNHINIWQVGINGRVMMPGVKDSYAENFFLSGFAYWGWKGCAGKLHEDITSYIGFGEQNGKARLNKADTRDFQLGFGYLFDWKHWNFGVSSGFAYDKQSIKTRSGKISYPSGATYVDAPIYGNGYQTVTKWWGPWLGTEVEYCRSSWRIGTGYEIHFAKFAAHHTIPDNFIARLQGVENKAHASHAYGNVVFLDGDYRFCEGWKVGGAFTYQNWQANNGRLKSDDSKLDDASSSMKVSSSASWIAYGFTINIGYTY